MPYPNTGVQYSCTPKTTLIFVNHRGRTICVGKVVDQRFVKYVKASKHFLRNPPAICLDSNNLDDAEQAGAIEVCIHNIETGRWYSVALTTFKAKCFTVTRGDGHQLGLTLDWWSIDGQQPEAERRAKTEGAKAKTATVKQLDLFGGCADESQQ